MDIPDLLAFCLKRQASDLHLSAGLPPLLRIHGDLRAINLPALSAPVLQGQLLKLMDDTQRQGFLALQECDFAFTLPGQARFRVNAFHQARGPAAAIRSIAAAVPSLEQLQAPPVLAALSLSQQGLILVTGPTGSGKSSTLAAMVRHINSRRRAHILTIEDPIEFVHESQQCLINQRALGCHTSSFASALRAALREDPDVILIGELRDLDSIRLALRAAETGHLVLATLHTSSAAQSIDRIIDVFPGSEQSMVRSMLAESLTAIIAQVLLKRADDSGRLAAHEILLANAAVRNLIREGKTAQIPSIMQTGAASGMQTLDQCLSALLRQRLISPDCAHAAARQPQQFTA